MVAYTRGIMLQREGDNALRDAGKMNNKIESKYFQAIEQYNSALHFDPKLADAYFRRGVCREHIEQFDASVSDYSQAVRLKPGNPEFWLRRAVALKNMQKFDQAILDYNACDNLQPGQERVFFDRAYCKVHTGDGKGALLDAQKAVAINGSAFNYCLQANALRLLGKFDEMDASFAKAVHASPHEASTYQNRAFSQFMLGRYGAAVGDFEKALHIDDWEGTDAVYSVIYCYFAQRLQKKDKEAAQLLDQAMKEFHVQKEVDAKAHNAPVSNDWPVPTIQYLHKDITRDKFIRSGQGDRSKETETHCYLGLQELIAGDKTQAKEYFAWVKDNGRRDYVEWEVAVRLLERN